MPAEHHIDNDLKLITTTWSGDATDDEPIDALLKYLRDIRSKPEYSSFNEIVDFNRAEIIKMSTTGLRRLAEIGVDYEVHGVKTRLAFILTTPLAYGLGRMYATYRSLIPGGVKEVRVFRQYQDALGWIEQKRGADSP
jgi:hypothetical protein